MCELCSVQWLLPRTQAAFDSGFLSREVGMDLFKHLLHKRYQAVDPGQDDCVFGQEEDDGNEALNIEKLSRMHNVLLSQAQDTISSTEDLVLSLQAERRGNEAAVHALAVAGAAETHRTSCCGLRTRCVIL